MAGRPLTGSIRPRGSGFLASIPIEKGSPKRVSHVFSDKVQAERWLRAGAAAVNAGRPVPGPEPYLHVSRKASGTEDDSFAAVARAWWEMKYGRRTSGSPETPEYVRSMLENHLIPFFSSRSDRITDITYQDVSDYIDFMAGISIADAPTSNDIDGSRHYTLSEAAVALSLSKSVVRKAWEAGRFPNSYFTKVSQKRSVIKVPGKDLEAAFGQRPPVDVELPIGYSLKFSAMTLAKLKHICNYAVGNRMAIHNPVGDQKAKSPIGNTRSDRPEENRPIVVFDWEESRYISDGLNIHHQLAFWLARMAGLRIGEIFGLRVSHAIKSGDRTLLAVRRQGGKWFKIRDNRTGTVSMEPFKEMTKTESSRRVIPLAAPLAELIDQYIETFHDGNYSSDATLVIATEGAGQADFRYALKKVLQREGLSTEDRGHRVSPHFFRACMSTDVSGLVPEMARSRYLGHRLQAHDGGSRMTAKSYTLERSDISYLVPVPQAIEKQIAESIGSINASEAASRKRARNANNSQNSLRPDAAANGSTNNEGTYISADEAAKVLGIGKARVERLGRRGVLQRRRLHSRQGKLEWMYEAASVEVRLVTDQELWTRRRICDELQIGLPDLAVLIGELGIKPVADTVTKGHRYTDLEVDRLRSHLDAIEKSLAGCTSLQSAAKKLDISHDTAWRLARLGQLEIDDKASALAKKAMITNTSLLRLMPETSAARHATPLPPPPGSITMREAKKISGMTQPELLKLQREGVIFYRTKDYRYHVDKVSLEQSLGRLKSL